MRRILPSAFAFALVTVVSGRIVAGDQDNRQDATRVSASLLKSVSLQQAQNALGVTELTVQRVALQRQSSLTCATLDLDGNTYTLDLAPHSLRSPDFKLRLAAGGQVNVAQAPAPQTYRAVVRRANGAQIQGGGAAMSITDGKLHGVIDIQDGQTWMIQPAQEIDPASPAGAHVVYRTADVLPTNGVCGVAPGSPHGIVPDRSAGPRGTGLKLTDIAIDCDFPYFQQNGESVATTLADLESVLNAVTFIYERDVQITYMVTETIIRTTSEDDPYTTIIPGTLLGQFAAHWSSGEVAFITRDVAHLMTGRNMSSSGGTIGIAYLSVVCGSSAYGVSQTKWSANFNNRVTVTAHELGHNWSAEHCNTEGDSCDIMCSGVGGCGGYGLPNFGPFEIGQITSFRNQISGCLVDLADPLDPPFFDTFSASGFDQAKWVLIDGALVSSGSVNPPTPPFALALSAVGGDPYQDHELRSNYIKLGSLTATNITYRTEHRDVLAGGQLMVDYAASDGSWINLNTVTSNGVSQNNFQGWLHTLDTGSHPLAFHDKFRLRFRCDVGSFQETWYVDNIGLSSGTFDVDIPTPNPMAWDLLPMPLSTTQIIMRAALGSDATSPPVQYRFNFVFGSSGGSDCDWEGCAQEYIDGGLLPNRTYTYECQARDSANPPNQTNLSPQVQTATLIESPAGINLTNVTANSMTLTALGSFTSLAAANSGIYFEMTPDVPGSGANAWVTTTSVNLTGLSPHTLYTFRVKSRNRLLFENDFVGPVVIATLPTPGTCPLPGDVRNDTFVNGGDIDAFMRVKFGAPLPGDIVECADFGNGGDLMLDTEDFVTAILGL
jgi:hypothetical protein